MDINKVISDIQSATQQIAETLQKIKTSQQRFDALESTHKEINIAFLAIVKQLENQQIILINEQKKSVATQTQFIDNKFVVLNTSYENAAKKLADTLAFFEEFVKATKSILAANMTLGKQIESIDFPKRFEETAKIWQTNITAQNKEIVKLSEQIKTGQNAQSEQIKALKVSDLLNNMTLQVEKLLQTVGNVKEKIQDTQLKIQETQTDLARLAAAQKEPFDKIQAQIVAINTEIQTQAHRQNLLIYVLFGLIVLLFLVVLFKS
jgi:hypothetical protein